VNDIPIILMIVAVPIVVLSAYVRHRAKQTARRLLEDWAQQADCRILSMQHRWFLSGPFPLPLNGQHILRFYALDKHRRKLSGWARGGAIWTGFIFKKRIEVQLD
jgi:hypothetical protein